MGAKQDRFEKEVILSVFKKEEYIKEKIITISKNSFFRVDFFVPSLNLAIEFDEYYHDSQSQTFRDYERENKISKLLSCQFVRFGELEGTVKAIEKLMRTIAICKNQIVEVETVYKTITHERIVEIPTNSWELDKLLEEERNNGILIGEMKQFFGDFYDYSEVWGNGGNLSYINLKCPIHGKFQRQKYEVRRGCGCQKCEKSNNKPGILFLSKVGNYIRLGFTNDLQALNLQDFSTKKDLSRFSFGYYTDPIKHCIFDSDDDIGKMYEYTAKAHNRLFPQFNLRLSGFLNSGEWFTFDQSIIDWFEELKQKFHYEKVE